MIEEIERALQEIGRQFDDSRVHYCQVEVKAVDDAVCELGGAVLAEATLQTVTAALARRFSAVTFRPQEIQILRRRRPTMLMVGTNLTGLHGGPSFGSEMLSQLLAGSTVERLLAQEKWLFVRQPDGYLGWVYEPYLGEESQASPTHLVADPIALLAAAPAPEAPLVSRLLAGTGVAIADEDGDWIRVEVPGFRSGWLPRAALRPCDAFPPDGPSQRSQMCQDAQRFIGVPYLWGGTSALGLDCSGYVQLLHRLSGLEIPRDADMQLTAGQAVEPPFQPGDLLFFGSGAGHRTISHVGMSLGGWEMIHASRPRNGVYVDDVQATERLREIFVDARTFVSGV